MSKTKKLTSSLGKWSEPLSVVTVIFGAVSFVTVSYVKIESNRESIENIEKNLDKIQIEGHDSDHDIREKISFQSERLSSIEGKIDIIIDSMNLRNRNK